MNFGQAVEELKNGNVVTRIGYNNEKIILSMIRNRECGTKYSITDCILAVTYDDKFMPWNASQVDILAEDWELFRLDVKPNNDDKNSKDKHKDKNTLYTTSEIAKEMSVKVSDVYKSLVANHCAEYDKKKRTYFLDGINSCFLSVAEAMAFVDYYRDYKTYKKPYLRWTEQGRKWLKNYIKTYLKIS